MVRGRRSNISRNTRRSRHATQIRSQESADQRACRLQADRQRHSIVRAAHRPIRIDYNRVAFRYDYTIQYDSHPKVNIGQMNVICAFCHAVKYKGEAPGLCCANGQVRLPLLDDPPQYLRDLVKGLTPESKHFLAHIQAFNSCFQMTSFGATNVINNGYMPTFKVISTYGMRNGAEYMSTYST